MKIPLSRPEVGAAEHAALGDVLASGWLGTGRLVAQFEDEVCQQVGGLHAVATNSGTAALGLALAALGLGPGDEVLVPSFTYCATPQAIIATGASAKWVEVDEASLCMDLEDARCQLGPAVKAILPVYFAGHAGDAARYADFAGEHGLHLVEDAAHAFGSWGPTGSVGSGPGLACFSFGPIKPFTCGQGGAVVLRDPDVAEEIRVRSDLGVRRFNDVSAVVSPGVRQRMHDLNAAIGLTQLGRREEIAASRRGLWERYNSGLLGANGIRMPAVSGFESVPFLFPVFVDARYRDAVRSSLAASGIGTGAHYPPNHLEPLFRPVGRPLPVTERLGQEVITLPLHGGMLGDDVDFVVERLTTSVTEHRRAG